MLDDIERGIKLELLIIYILIEIN